MKVGLIISASHCHTCVMQTYFIVCRFLWERQNLSWRAFLVGPVWFESRRDTGSEETKINSFQMLHFTSEGCIHQEEAARHEQRVCFCITPLSCDAGGRGGLILFGPLFRQTQFCLQMQFNEFWMLLGDWAAVHLGAVPNLHPSPSMFGRKVSVLIQRFWHKLIPLSAAKADSRSLH